MSTIKKNHSSKNSRKIHKRKKYIKSQFFFNFLTNINGLQNKNKRRAWDTTDFFSVKVPGKKLSSCRMHEKIVFIPAI